MCCRPGRSRIASYSASVCPPGTPNTCRTPCSASKPASSAPPCWPGGTTPLMLARGDGPPEPLVLARGDGPPEPLVLARGDGPPEPLVLARGDDPPEPPDGSRPRSSVTGPWPRWPAPESGTGNSKQPGGGAAKYEFLGCAEAQRA